MVGFIVVVIAVSFTKSGEKEREEGGRDGTLYFHTYTTKDDLHSWKVHPLRHVLRIVGENLVVRFVLRVWHSELANLHLSITEASVRDPRIPQPGAE